MKFYILKTNRKNGNHISERLDWELRDEFRSLLNSNADYYELSELVAEYDGKHVDSYSRDFRAKLGEVEFDFVDDEITKKYFECESEDREALIEQYNIAELWDDGCDNVKIVANLKTTDEWTYRALYKCLSDEFDYHGAVYLFKKPE